MTELLPGPEDAGKHLFEISPGRREPLQALCWGRPWGPRWGCDRASGLEGPISFRMLLPVGTSTLSPSTTQKFGTHLEDIANLGAYQKIRSIVWVISFWKLDFKIHHKHKGNQATGIC